MHPETNAEYGYCVTNNALLQGVSHPALIQVLHAASGNLAGRLEPLEWQAEAYRRTGDMFHLPEALLAIANAATNAGNLERAKTAYEELLQNDPENTSYRQFLAQVCEQLGVEAPANVEAEAPPQAEVAEAAAVSAEPQMDEETERFVHQALTDVNFATARVFEAGNHSQCCGFATAGGAYEYDKLFILDINTRPIDRYDVLFVYLSHISQLNTCHEN